MNKFLRFKIAKDIHCVKQHTDLLCAHIRHLYFSHNLFSFFISLLPPIV